MTVEIRNAIITATFLGFEDHGILTFSVTVDYGVSVQGTPPMGMGKEQSLLGPRVGSLLRAVGVSDWESLKGKHVRVLVRDALIRGVGHIIENRWSLLADHLGGTFEQSPTGGFVSEEGGRVFIP